MIQDLSGSSCIKETGESTLVTDSLVSLMYPDPDRSWITDPGQITAGERTISIFQEEFVCVST